MKILTPFLQFSGMTLFCGMLLLACNDPEATPEPEPNPSNSINANVNVDSISNHLQFYNAIKIQGTIPKGPLASSLKISLEDTLYLRDELKVPIKFLHEDTTKNVAGIYVQVHGATNATYYYDVPEIPDMADSDTVSVIMIGVDPAGLADQGGVPPAGAPPFTFEITITPYNEGGLPLDETTRPVKISEPKIDPNGYGSSCGLVLPPGDFWLWHLSLIEDSTGNGKLFFYNDPNKIWGEGGQFITGCCINGESYYNTALNCHLDPTMAQRKLFPTFFQHQESATKFFDNGTYSQFSKQMQADPDPPNTDFCGVRPGEVIVSSSAVTEEGTWTITERAPYKGDSLYLSVIRTASNGVGLPTPNGFIHQLDCNVMTLVHSNHEGKDLDVVSFYARVNTSEDGWYEIL